MKGLLAILAGYFAMALTVFALLMLAYAVLGVNGSFKPGTYDVSLIWSIVMLIVGVGSALLGGWICRKISDHTNTVKILAVVVIVLGILSAIPSFTVPIPTDVRPDNVSSMDAMMKAITPKWVTIANIVIGAVGVLVGGKALGK